MRCVHNFLQFVIATGFVILLGILGVQATNSRVRLKEHITNNYHSGIRPVLDTSTVTNVTLRVLFHYLIDLDTKRQLFTISVWVKETWRDEFISWNTSEFDGIESMYIPSHMIWKPDITLYTNVDPEFTRYKPDPLSLIWYDGSVQFLSPAIMTSYCKISVRLFPFDTQVCEMTFGSWSHTALQMMMIPDLGNLEPKSYLENGIWDLQSVKVKSELVPYTCCPNNFSEVVYKLTFRRRPEFYVVHLILPGVFLSVLSFLVFYLPSDCGEKLTFAITNLLALVVFQQIIADHIPPTGVERPIIDNYFLMKISLVCMSVALTICVIHVAAKNYPVPPSFFKIIKILELALCVNCTRERKQDTSNLSSVNSSRQSYFTATEDGTSGAGNSRDITGHPRQYRKEHAIAKDTIEAIADNAEGHSCCGDFSADWKRVGLVLDRVFLVSLFSFLLLMTFLLVLRIYGESKNGIADADGTELLMYE